ncbi:hypothetical protein D3C81_1901940 [compost metagenome]
MPSTDAVSGLRVMVRYGSSGWNWVAFCWRSRRTSRASSSSAMRAGLVISRSELWPPPEVTLAHLPSFSK